MHDWFLDLTRSTLGFSHSFILRRQQKKKASKWMYLTGSFCTKKDTVNFGNIHVVHFKNIIRNNIEIFILLLKPNAKRNLLWQLVFFSMNVINMLKKFSFVKLYLILTSVFNLYSVRILDRKTIFFIHRSIL